MNYKQGKHIPKNILAIAITILFFSIVLSPFITAVETIKKSSMSISNSNNLYVRETGEGNYTRIQDAIDAAGEGDTVFVYNDSSPYIENIFVNKSINLIGENKNTTVIDGNKDNYVIYVSADWVNISRFTIKYGCFHGIDINSNYNSITSNIIKRNGYWGDWVWSGGGIELDSSNNNIISDNDILNNCLYGMFIWNSSSNIITGNTISSHDLYGIHIDHYSNKNIIKSNTISNSKGGIILDDSNNNTIYKNNFFNNMPHAFFGDCTNSWEQNYWGRPRILPKLIFGAIKINSRWILRLNIDWCPAKIPYGI